jgi:hypothetical protein
MIAAAILGFLVDAVRVVAMIAFVVCAVGLAVSLLRKKAP